ESVRERLGWANTFRRWTEEIEGLAASPRQNIGPGRRLILIDVTNSASDPSNSGVINVSRRLAAQLLENPELFVVFGIWDNERDAYVLPTASQRPFLESY